VADLVELDCRLAARAASGLAAIPGVEILNDVVLNQVLVRFGERGDSDHDGGDACTAAVIAAVQASGEAWFGGTTWAGRTAARVSVSAWSTTDADIDRLVAAVGRAMADSAPR
jgi:selenocysteine lyase/cysteine desulfurase